MSDGDNTELEEYEEILRVAKNRSDLNFIGTCTSARVMLKAKRRVFVSHQILSPYFDYALSIPVPSNSSSAICTTVSFKTIQEQSELGKTIRETVLLNVQQYNPKHLWPLIPLALDHLILNDRNISKKTEHTLCFQSVSIATDLQNQFYSYDPNTSIHVLGLPNAVWNKMFRYLDIQDLKSFRRTCVDANSLVESSLPWAVNVCFIHDEKVHPRQGQYPEIPVEMTCTDDSVGWPDIRIRNFKSPFPGKKYFSIDNQQKFFKIKVLEIHDSSLHWTDLLEAISCLPELRELSYAHTKEYLYQNNVLKVLKGELNDHSEIAKAINKNQTKFKKLRSSKSSSSSKTLHNVKLQGLNLEITNFVLALLNQFCRDLKELDLVFWEGLFLHASTPAIQPHRSAPSSAPLVGATFPGLEAWKLINNNQESLTALRIGFLEERQHRRIGPCFTPNPNIKQIPIAPILMAALHPRHEKLKLHELILEFPPTVGVQASRMKYPNKTEQEILTYDSQLITFCSSQITGLWYFNLKTVIDFSCRIEDSLLTVIPQDKFQTIFDKDKIVIGKCMTCTEEPIRWDLMVGWSERGVIYEFNLYLDDSSIPYEKIFGQDMPAVTNCYLLQIIVRKSTPLKDFYTNRLLLKFPNLKRLALVNSCFRGTTTLKYEDFPKITDFDLQAIIYFLPSLKELVLQCNMSEVTDFGLAGITITASERMNKQGQYTVLPEDRLGQSISKMKYLQVLELHGLGNKVTGVTAYLAFEPCALEELYLFSPKFSKRQKKDLKDKFALKKNFKMMIL